jgi:Sec7-like guanine-nucleotide exchange factor
MTVLKIEKKEVSGIEFYVSNDGKHRGMSITGLALLCGVKQHTMTENLQKLAIGSSTMKELEAIAHQVFIPSEGYLIESNAKIVSSKACAKIISHYAMVKNNPVAKESLLKFSEMGIDSWIDEVTGSGQVDNREILGLLHTLVDKVDGLTTKLDNYQNSVKAFPLWAEKQQQLVEQYNSKVLIGTTVETVFLKDWLHKRGVSLNKSQWHKFVNLVAETYRTMVGEDPIKLPSPEHGALVNSYNSSHAPIIEIAFKTLMLNT